MFVGCDDSETTGFRPRLQIEEPPHPALGSEFGRLLRTSRNSILFAPLALPLGMTLADETQAAVDEAAVAITAGEAVVYPTETVYGLAADATDPAAVDRVFKIKNRPQDKPLSVAFADADHASQYTEPTDCELTFIQEFLPGPVTVIVDRQPTLPDLLTDGRPRVGVRIPDNEAALALCQAAGPITATSANRSGEPSVTDPADLPSSVRDFVGAVVDTGPAPGTESTVVDIQARDIIRRGALVDEIEAWLAEH